MPTADILANAIIDDAATAILGVETDPDRLTRDEHRRMFEMVDEQIARLADNDRLPTAEVDAIRESALNILAERRA